MSTSVRIKDCIDNHDKYVEILATKSDKELAKRLNLVHIQMELADKAKNIGSLELLEIWRTQIIEARIYKAENKIADVPSDIELAIANMETFNEKAEQRQEILNETRTTVIEEETEQPQEKENPNKPEQLSLF
ncbi:MAG: hypothetical protein AABZ32_04950 [Bacteroidota bacterium]